MNIQKWFSDTLRGSMKLFPTVLIGAVAATILLFITVGGVLVFDADLASLAEFSKGIGLGLEDLKSVIYPVACLILVAAGLSWLLFSVLAYEAASMVSRGDSVAPLPLFRAGLVSFLPFVVVSLIYGLMVGVGMLCFLVPGIYFAAKYYLALPIVVHERCGPMVAMERSAKLTEGLRVQMIAIHFLGIFLAMLFGQIVNVALNVAMLPFTMMGEGTLVLVPLVLIASFGIMVSWLGGALIQAVGAMTAYRLVHETKG